MAPAAKEQENGGREESKEEIIQGEKDDMTTVSTTTTLSELGRGWALMCFCLLTSLPLRNRVLAIKKNNH